MNVAFAFPGQGMEQARMGLELASELPAAAELLGLASEMTGVDLPAELQRGDLARHGTWVLQPALVAVSLGANRALRQLGLTPGLVVGHSLGEVSAWAASGCIDDRDAVALAHLRGRLMEREANRNPGGMLALLTDDERTVNAVCAAEHLELAAHNAPDEWIIAGGLPALRRVAAAAACRSRPLAVAGAWHSAAMRGAVDELGEAIGALPRRRCSAGFVSSVDGSIASPRRIPALLTGQLTRPVRWVRAMTTLAASGVTDIVTLGPGRVLRALVRKNLGTAIRVHATERLLDLQQLRASLR